MSELNFTTHSDQGAPQFYTGAGELLGIEIEAGERGRWLGNVERPLGAGLGLTLSGELRTDLAAGEAEVVVVFWRDEPGLVLHSTRRAFALNGRGQTFTPFVYTFAVPPGVKALRLDLRAWTGAGIVEARGLRLREDEAPPPELEPEPDPLPIPPPPSETAEVVTGYKWGRNLMLFIHPLEPDDHPQPAN